jgi:serine carboxypeptidase-like clade 2
MSLFAFFLVFCMGLVHGQIISDKVTYLPGVGTPKVTMYSGYLNFTSLVSGTTRHMHYVFIECTGTPAAQAPTVLWLNGGPGCSSLDGLFNELGPYLLKDGEWFLSGEYNPYTWVTEANVLFLESPVNVGFSYDSEDKDPVYNDFNTAQDNLKSVQTFFSAYGYLNKTNFWIAGESYAGMYIPQLAKWLLDNQTEITLQGVLIGNGVTDFETLTVAAVEYMGKHSFFSSDLQNLTYKACAKDQFSPACFYAIVMWQQTQTYQNPYNVYGECFNITAFQAPEKHKEALERYKSSKGNKFQRTPWFAANPSKPNPFLKSDKQRKDLQGKADEILCTWDIGIYNYLNSDSVMEEMHVNSDIEYQLCSNDVSNNYDVNLYNGTYWIYSQMRERGVKILVFNGDNDDVVPYNDFFKWFPRLNWGEEKEEWKAWYAKSDQGVVDVSGFVTVWEGLTFVTVRGAGHMVPQFRPEAAQYMLRKFLKGEPF